MDYRQHFSQQLEYDRWAMVHLIKQFEEHALEGSPEQSLFNHVALAQIVWMQRVRGETPTRSAFENPRITLEQSAALAAEGHGALEAMLAQTDEAEFERVIDYVDSRGNPYRNRISDIVMHVFNHGTHHRGQINMMLRQRGLTPAWIDYILLKR